MKDYFVTIGPLPLSKIKSGLISIGSFVGLIGGLANGDLLEG
jgi:hypothetical protein